VKIIDIHTHLMSEEWIEFLHKHGGDRFQLRNVGSRRVIYADGQDFVPLFPTMFDLRHRIEKMDANDIEMAILSLTAPGVVWGNEEISRRSSAIANDHLASVQDGMPARFRWLASLPMHHPAIALEELRRCRANGASGVIMFANVDGKPLTDPVFAPIWEEIEKFGMPVMLHPTLPAGTKEMHLNHYHLIAMVGFMFDSTLALARMIFDGFFDRYTKLKFIVPHSGGTLPFIAHRLDHGYSSIPECRTKIQRPPSSYFSQIYFDDANSTAKTVRLCADLTGEAHILHGSDYPFLDLGESLKWADDLPPARRSAILGGNAAQLFGTA
jgi:aminocarboxymuconate-semialdehyde decarboxylase